VQNLGSSTNTVCTDSEIKTEHQIFEKLGAHSNEDIRKFLPENLVAKFEKTFLLAKRTKFNEVADGDNNKKQKTAL
jgi:hypothetical protein